MEEVEFDVRRIGEEGIEEDLNDEQLKAVKMDKHENIQIIAGPGTGKTKTLVNRLLYLVGQCEVEPEKILVLTFTNRAVQIFREILFRLAPSYASRIQIHTFHSYCQSLIVEHWEEIGLRKGWSIADELDQEYILTDIIREVMGSYGREIRNNINKFYVYKRDSLVGNGRYDEKMNLVLEKYSDRLKEENMIDYDGILKYGYELAKKYCNVRGKVSPEISAETIEQTGKATPTSTPTTHPFSHILIDEFQDANLFQWNLAQAISKQKSAITVVGDPDQSIFSFQGANSNLLNIMSSELPTVKQVVLTQNYRSSQEIIDVATSIIREDETHFLNHDHFPIGQFNHSKPVLKKCLNPLTETTWVANKIHHLILNEKVPPNSIAVLVRTNARKDFVASLLRQKGIEVSIYGPLSLLKSPYIRHLYSFLKFIQNFDQDIQLLYMLRNPNKILSPKQLAQAKSFSESRNLTLYETLSQHKLWLTPTFRSNKSKKSSTPDLDEFLSIIHQSSQIIHNNIHDPHSLVTGLQLVSQYLTFSPKYQEKAKIKQQQLFDLIISLAPCLKDESTTLSSSLITHTRLQDIMSKPSEIVVSTIHNAKGLEWDNVFVMDVTDKNFPHVMSNSEKEERRILYVGLTRAKTRLFVSYPVLREWSDGENKISRFLTPSVISNFDVDLAETSKTAYQQEMISRFENFNSIRKERPNLFRFPEGTIIGKGKQFSTFKRIISKVIKFL